jgi:hypothetical protein
MPCPIFTHRWKGLLAGLFSLIATYGMSHAEPYQTYAATGLYLQNHDGDTFRLHSP